MIAEEFIVARMKLSTIRSNNPLSVKLLVEEVALLYSGKTYMDIEITCHIDDQVKQRIKINLAWLA